MQLERILIEQQNTMTVIPLEDYNKLISIQGKEEL
jgi:hypothetical protein